MSDKDARAAEAIRDLRALMADLRRNVEDLKAILNSPEVPDGDPAAA